MVRSIVALVVLLVTFAVLAAFFMALDTANGVHVHAPRLVAADVQHTPTSAPMIIPTTPRPTLTAATGPGMSTPTAGPAVTATPSASTPLPPSATASPLPTPPGGVTPPHYGTSFNYVNNTSFSPDVLHGVDEHIIALTNEERAAHGLSAVAESGALDVVAAARSQDMVMRNYFNHFDPTGAIDGQGHRSAAVQELLQRNDISYAEVGENLVSNTNLPLDAGTPSQVVRAWMRHPEHRDNILHPSYTAIGVGMAAANESVGLRVVITQIFVR